MSWNIYQPTRQNPWNVRRVVHLHRRSGFAATWSEIQRDLREGPQAAIDRVLAGESHLDGRRDDFSQAADLIANAATSANNANQLKAWWLYRMVFSPDSLGERLTLMWHNHFATSNLKIANVGTMLRQNQLFRDFGRKPFGELLRRTVKDPAILIWLDADSNRRQHPNENLARELMELFTMGVGNYSEDDVKQAARALTGWTTKDDAFRFVKLHHDPGEKQFLGQRSRLNGDELLEQVTAHPATAERIARRLCEQFFGEHSLPNKRIRELASGLRRRNLDINWAVEKILRSEAFFDAKNMGTRVLGPVELLVGAIRALELFAPAPSTMVMSEWTARLGQDLFYPPNVFGWPGGREWITTRSMIGRFALASAIGEGSLHRPQSRRTNQTRPHNSLVRHIQTADDQQAFIQLIAQLLSADSSAAFCDRIAKTLGRGTSGKRNGPQANVVEAVLASPEAQLG